MKKKYKSTKFIIKKLLFNNFENSTFLNIFKILLFYRNVLFYCKINCTIAIPHLIS